MIGGVGDDAYVVDNAVDQVVENAGEGSDTVFASVNYALTANVENSGAPGRRRPAGLRQRSGQLDVRQYRQQSPRRRRRRRRHERRAGNDTYFVDNAGDAVIESVGEGNDTVFSTASTRTDGERRKPGPARRRRPAGLRQRSGQRAVRQYRQQSPRRRRRRRRHERRCRQRHLLRRQCRRRGDRERRRGQRHGLLDRSTSALVGERGKPGPARRRRPAGLRQRPRERALRQYRQQPPRRRRRRRRHERRRRQRHLLRRQCRRRGDRERRRGQRHGVLDSLNFALCGERGKPGPARRRRPAGLRQRPRRTRSSAIPATTSSTAAPAPTP